MELLGPPALVAPYRTGVSKKTKRENKKKKQLVAETQKVQAYAPMSALVVFES